MKLDWLLKYGSFKQLWKEVSKFEQEKKQKNFYHHYLLFFQFAFINGQPNTTFSAFAINYVWADFLCIKSKTKENHSNLCNKVALFGKHFILVQIIEVTWTVDAKQRINIIKTKG